MVLRKEAPPYSAFGRARILGEDGNKDINIRPCAWDLISPPLSVLG